MPRSRNIKPGFFVNDKLGECEPLARLLFAGLWCIADREGRLEDRPKRIKAEVLPYDDCDAENLLQQLAARGFIVRYEVNAEKYIAIPNFRRHQNPHKAERASDIPAPASELAPCEHEASTVQVQCKHDGTSESAPETHGTNPADSLIADSLIPDPGFLKEDSSVCSETASPSSEPAAAVLSFPCDGNVKEFHLTPEKLAEYRESFPSLDVLAEMRKARQWILDHPEKRKTARGMPKFLGGWLSRTQNDETTNRSKSHGSDRTRACKYDPNSPVTEF